MKQIILSVILVLVTAGIAGGAGYMLGTQNGLTQAQSIQAEFFRQRGGGQFAQGGNSVQSGQTQQGQGQQAQGQQTQGQQGQRNNPGAQNAQPGQAGPGGLAAFAQRGIGGTVKSVNGNVIQMTETNGATINVRVDDRTVYEKFTSMTLADIRANTLITVTGVTSDTTGTVTARLIQVGAGQ